MELKEKIELKMLRRRDENIDYNINESDYYSKKLAEFTSISLNENKNPMSEATFIDIEIYYFNQIFAELKQTRKLNEMTAVQNYIRYLNKKKQTTGTPPVNITPLICEQKHLQRLHADFDGKVWQSVDLETFLNYMRVEPIGQITVIGINKNFAVWLRQNIENQRNAVLVPNMNEWFKKLIGKNINYSSQFQNT